MMGKAKRNRILRTQAENKSEARKLRRGLWRLGFPKTKHFVTHPGVPVTPFNLSPEEWRRMQRAQQDYRR